MSPFGQVNGRACGRAATLAGLAALALAAPAQARVTPGHGVTVLANIDMVVASGWEQDDVVTATITRGGRIVGSATGTARALPAPDGFGLEINHGPAGAPQPGDCWDGHTPDILAGDLVTVTAERGGVAAPEVDTAVVADLEITGEPVRAGEDVVVEGIATFADGTAIPASALVEESRNIGPLVRATATSLGALRGLPGGWRASYAAPGYGVDPSKGGAEPQSVKRDAILDANIGHSLTYDDGAGLVQGAEGIGDASGPAAGCEGSRAERNTIEGADRDAINRATAGSPVVVHGLAAGDVTAPGDVRLSVNGAAVDAGVTIDAAARTWSATIPVAELPAADGPVSIEADFPNSTFDTSDGARTTLVELVRDTVAPAAPSADPPAGTYVGSRSVKLTSADASATIHYTNDGSTPTAANAVVGGALPVTASQTLRAIAVDPAGNPSAVTTLAYVIESPAQQAGPPPVAAAGQAAGGVTVTRLPGAGSAATAPKGSSLRLKSLTAGSRLELRTARAKGLRLVMRLDAGTAVVRIRVYRRLAGGRRVLLTSGFRSPGSAVPYRVQLRERKLRGALRAGRYEVEVTPGAARTDLGRSSRVDVRIVR
jgi:hypothetical protein